MPTDVPPRKPFLLPILGLLAYDGVGIALLSCGAILWTGAAPGTVPPPLALPLVVLGSIWLGAGMIFAFVLARRCKFPLNRPRT